MAADKKPSKKEPAKIPPGELPESVLAFLKTAEARAMPLRYRQQAAVGIAKEAGELPREAGEAKFARWRIERACHEV